MFLNTEVAARGARFGQSNSLVPAFEARRARLDLEFEANASDRAARPLRR